jgi:hypothetical protein
MLRVYNKRTKINFVLASANIRRCKFGGGGSMRSRLRPGSLRSWSWSDASRCAPGSFRSWLMADALQVAPWCSFRPWFMLDALQVLALVLARPWFMLDALQVLRPGSLVPGRGSMSPGVPLASVRLVVC